MLGILQHIVFLSFVVFLQTKLWFRVRACFKSRYIIAPFGPSKIEFLGLSNSKKTSNSWPLFNSTEYKRNKNKVSCKNSGHVFKQLYWSSSWDLLSSVGYSKKDIQDIQDIRKNFWYQEIIYSTKDFFTKIRSLEKKLMVKKRLKNLLYSNCDLWSLQNRHSRKQQSLIYLSHEEKSTSLVLLKIPFYVRYTNTKNANSKGFFFWKGFLLELWSLIFPKPACLKTTEYELFEPWRKKITLLVLLKIPFYVR